MIQAAMLIALGFLCAALLTLALIPALARRADRLARKRAEAAFPLSLAEIAADRDHLRAELAVKMRAAEQQAEKGFSAKAGAMQELGRRDMEIARLKQVLGEREQRITELEVTLAETSAARDDLARELTAERQAHAEAVAASEQRGATLAERDRALDDTRTTLAETQAELAARSAALEAEQAAHQAAAARAAAGETELTQLRSEHERLRVAQVEARTQFLVIQAKRDELADALAATGASLSRAEAELLVMAAERDGQRERGDAFAARIAQAEAGLAAADARARAATTELQQAVHRHKEEVAALDAKHQERDRDFEALRAELRLLEGALAQARADGEEARRELAAARRMAGDAGEASALRREIVRLADSLMEMPAKREAAE